MTRKVLLTLAAPLALAGCLPAFQPGAPVLHDISLFSAEGGVLYGYVYGEGTELEVGGRTLELTAGTADDPLAVPGALLVGGEPYLSQSLPPLEPFPFTATRAPFSSDLVISVSRDLSGALYYDGERWFTLLGEARAGYRSRVVPRTRLGGLYGLGELTREEAAVFEAALAARGPLVVAALDEAGARTRQIGGLGGYRNTVLAVQEGVAVASVPEAADSAEDEGAGEDVDKGQQALSWEVLASGSQAAGGDGVTLEVATSQSEFEGLWRRAYGNLTSPPPLPQVDFSQGGVAAAFLGTRPTGGYSVDVRAVREEGSAVVVELVITEPAPGALTTQALTHPWVMVAIRGAELGEVWFRDAASGALLGVARALGGK
ncbi:protease complex subunit PrcB family protein [Truepera radiovictrix]|uniref:PrcB C-terminal domain-containing protein n=1 Tax=Truepera radiovictrix (strain DSM 17093 / CIP 108686 / LMG 22925 / RQ-24) TaxID=649638 RepID=D7CSN5_TRURR|nr:protease complex subunit PrcB family protein [Truepera radiovictrix]ADI15455.1 conserved hypothetical protein [Truepera radiovictrix DSM 17093]WMT55994.1 protease complex subunit PrcB family protein [Truepera radiovictrix]